MKDECSDNHREWSKLCRMRYLLDNWQNIFDPGITSTWATFTGISGTSTGSRVPLPLPPMAHHESVKRLERALTVLAGREPVLARHLKAYRCNAEWRCTDQIYFRQLPSGKMELDERRVREKIVPSWVSTQKVAQAESRLLSLLREDVNIPPELWRALDKP